MFSVCYILTQRMSTLEVSFLNDSALYKCSLNNNNNNNNINWIMAVKMVCVKNCVCQHLAIIYFKNNILAEILDGQNFHGKNLAEG